MVDGVLRQVIETVGLLGVVVSLIFVGLEVRQNSISTRSATNAAVADAFIELNLVLASNPELARIIAEHAGNPEAASPREISQLLAFWRGIFHIWSNAHRQHLNDTLDPAIYSSIVQEVTTYAEGSVIDQQLSERGTAMRWAWESERYIFNPDFQAFIDEKLGIVR